jgi:inosine/xanthosine triphosphatase
MRVREGARAPNLVLGSTSPVKLEAVREIARELIPGATVTGLEVGSGIRPQPMSDEEAIQGARTRAEAARRPGCIAVGIEAGVSSVEGRWYGCTWVVVLWGSEEVAVASSARYPLPDHLTDALLAGEALGDALKDPRDATRAVDGAVDVLTGGRVTRRHLTLQALRLALASLMAPAARRPPRPGGRSAT